MASNFISFPCQKFFRKQNNWIRLLNFTKKFGRLYSNNIIKLNKTWWLISLLAGNFTVLLFKKNFFRTKYLVKVVKFYQKFWYNKTNTIQFEKIVNFNQKKKNIVKC